MDKKIYIIYELNKILKTCGTEKTANDFLNRYKSEGRIVRIEKKNKKDLIK